MCQLCRLSKATARGATSGRRRDEFLTRRLRRPTAASERSRGWRSMPEKKRSIKFKEWLPQETVDAIRDFRVAIKGPLTTPVGGGIRSLNVTLRQLLDLYACVRPVRYFEGVPSPVKTSRAHGRGDLPRKYRGRVRRHRMEVRHARSEEADRFPEQRDAEGREEKDSRRFRRGHQADFSYRHQAPGAARDSARDRSQPHAW